ncbi:MAG: serine/threonine-protein kinase [Thermoanaerobaculia bacterium]|nr:serine/threonine-protein kinase [Thermoanaerobaculia bacterium]
MSAGTDDPRSGRWQRVGDLLEAALERPAGERESFVRQAAAGDEELVAEVLSLLAADQRAPGFLDSGVFELVAGALAVAAEPPGSEQVVGEYRLLRELGRGGMSRVHLAEPLDDRLGRQVAIKRLVAAAGAREELGRRLAAEGRVLAALAHPHIAQVFDAGIDADGDPYLVMEYVDGEPLVAWCAREDASIECRIELFLEVCAAVAHAHRRFVVHRDLKPSNILVDRAARVKLLDFGIAKLLDPAAPGGMEPPTRTGLLPMTPEYAAPEQVRGGEITTATDVWQLGILLHELLTGRRPYRFEGRSAADLERLVCGREATLPSATVTAAGSGRTDEPLAGAPPLSPLRLAAALRGDLDTIVLHALEKDPAARYGSVEALAEDLRRWRAGLPIRARPATRRERLVKFVRRHRAGVALSVAALAGGLAFVIALVLQVRATAVERDRARLESRKAGEVTAFLLDLFESSDPAESRGEEIPARELLARGAERIRGADLEPELRARMLDVLGRVHGKLGSFERAAELLEEALRTQLASGPGDGLAAAEVRTHLAEVRLSQADGAGAERLLREALEIRRRLAGETSLEVASTLNDLAVAMRMRDEAADAEPLLVGALAILEGRSGEAPVLAAQARVNLGETLVDLGRYETAEAHLREGMGRLERLGGPAHPDLASAQRALASLLARLGRFAEAEPLQAAALALRRELYGATHPLVAQVLNDLAYLQEMQGNFEGAAATCVEALSVYERTFGAGHQAVAILAANLAQIELKRRRPAAAEELARRAQAIYRDSIGSENASGSRVLVLLGAAREKQGDPEGAERLYREALAVARRNVEPGHPRIGTAALETGRLLAVGGRLSEAVPLLAEAHQIYGERLGAASPHTRRAGFWLGWCRAKSGEPDGEALWRESLEALRRGLPPSDPQLEEAERAAARLFAPGEADQALEGAQLAVLGGEQAGGEQR